MIRLLYSGVYFRSYLMKNIVASSACTFIFHMINIQKFELWSHSIGMGLGWVLGVGPPVGEKEIMFVILSFDLSRSGLI